MLAKPTACSSCLLYTSRAIKKHAADVEELERAYKALEHAVDKALGESVYDNQKALINNMREQRAHLRAMWEAEESKKKTDSGKVNQYKEQYEELGRQIEDTIAAVSYTHLLWYNATCTELGITPAGKPKIRNKSNVW